MNNQLFVLRPRPESPLRQSASAFNVLLVYSYLVYRKDSARTVADISTYLKFHHVTVAECLKVLGSLDLVEKLGRKYKAMRPPDSYFYTRKSTDLDHWFNRLAYLPIKIPERVLTPRQNLIYWQIASLPNRPLAYYAKVLDIGIATVKRAITKLRQLHLLCPGRAEVLPLSDANDFWADKSIAAEAEQDANPPETLKLHRAAEPEPMASDDAYDDVVSRVLSNYESADFFDGLDHFRARLVQYKADMLAVGFTVDEAAEVFEQSCRACALPGENQTLAMIELFWCNHFGPLLRAAQATSDANRKVNRFRGRNCGPLLRARIIELMPTMKKVWLENKNRFWTVAAILESQCLAV